MQTGFGMFVETIVPSDELIVSRTDLKGRITHVNETFASISGYRVEELIGQSHNIVRHPDMPRSVFEELWSTLHKEQMWKGYIKNRRKDGGYYWVYAEVSGVYKDGELVEYKSLRAPIEPETKIKMQTLYDEKRALEEKCVRVVTYLPLELVEKVKSLAHDEKCSDEAVLKELLNDTLL